MHNKEITYVDYNGVERTEIHHFNISAAELSEMQLTTDGGIKEKIERIVQEKNQKELIRLFKEIIKVSYGVKSDDGRRFIKNEEVWNNFSQTEAYTTLFMELATNDKSAIKFINETLPREEEIKKYTDN